MSDRFNLALSASWLVNSPAISRVLQRWSIPPERTAWLSILGSLELGANAWLESPALRAKVSAEVRSLGTEPYAVEAISKVLALLVPDVVPLMPAAARKFVLGENVAARSEEDDTFAAMVDWFARTVVAHRPALDLIAASSKPMVLSGPQALDRLLWFDSEGHRHFADAP